MYLGRYGLCTVEYGDVFDNKEDGFTSGKIGERGLRRKSTL